MGMKKALILDAALLLIYAAAANPSVTGVPVHEWLGVGLVLLVLAHVAARFGRIVDALKGLAGKGGHKARLLLNVLLVAALMTCAVSGVMVSATVLPAFGLYATGYYFWDPLHAMSAKVLLALLLVHIALNWKAIMVLAKRKGTSDDQ